MRGDLQMRIRCPACGAECSLDAAVGHDAASHALSLALKALPAGGLIVRYLALFRPAERALSWARVDTLLSELLPAISQGVVQRDGRSHAAPLAAWVAALEKIVLTRDTGRLTLPLKSHGYLHEIVIAEAARATAHDAALVGWAPTVQSTMPAKPASAAQRGIDKLNARRL